MGTTIIGIDCSTDPKRVGLAKATLNTDGVLKDWNCEPELKRDEKVIDLLREWIDDRNCLLALDAPLGWPAEFSKIIMEHTAGKPITIRRDVFFYRRTDLFIKGKFGKPPLSVRPFRVGADKIAATAHWALNLLAKLGGAAPLSLAWQPGEIGATCAIEVYPSATLASYGWTKSTRAKSIQLVARAERLSDEMQLTLPARCYGSQDTFDAVVCVLAGRDFLTGPVYKPEEPETAKKEGWIWVRKPK